MDSSQHRKDENASGYSGENVDASVRVHIFWAPARIFSFAIGGIQPTFDSRNVFSIAVSQLFCVCPSRQPIFGTVEKDLTDKKVGDQEQSGKEAEAGAEVAPIDRQGDGSGRARFLRKGWRFNFIVLCGKHFLNKKTITFS